VLSERPRFVGAIARRGPRTREAHTDTSALRSFVRAGRAAMMEGEGAGPKNPVFQVRGDLISTLVLVERKRSFSLGGIVSIREDWRRPPARP